MARPAHRHAIARAHPPRPRAAPALHRRRSRGGVRCQQLPAGLLGRGGDTASALAAGCPVVVKAHSAHPGTSELVGRAVCEAVRQAGLPAGVFAMLAGSGHGIGETLVTHPAIQAVGFTGSRGGGTALMAACAARPQPIGLCRDEQHQPRGPAARCPQGAPGLTSPPASPPR